ncbi:related to p53-related protein kinase [Pseudozyma flocculosa]|uniref:non-specific serine/threonine protein kinase n=1 Tax=Pseudozyma flocculosa TaxID=84751 RepID=A0A5C3EU01_9BASI|nr:related to p53-related protein kinase [Pseudozyma flocculosa]
MFRKNSTKKAKPASDAAAASAPSSNSGIPVPARLAFPASRSRPSSMVDTGAGFDASVEAALSSSASSSIQSFGTSTSPSQKHSLSAIERLASAQKKDAAASSSSSHVRVRTSSNTSRSSVKLEGSEGSRSRKSSIPTLIKVAAVQSPSKPSTSVTTTVESSQPAGSSDMQRSSSRSSVVSARTATSESAAGLLAQLGTGESSPKKVHSGATSARQGPKPSAAQDPVTQPETTKPKPNASAADSSPSQQRTAGLPSASTSTSTSSVLKKPAPPPLVALLADAQTSKLIKQGAEAKVYISQLMTDSVLTWPPPPASSRAAAQTLPVRLPILLKWRFPKTYRHPTLSDNITASRTIMEARALLRCAKAGVAVPGVRCVDEKEGILGLELIAGKSVREWLGGGAEGEDEELVDGDDDEATAEEEDEEVLSHEDQVKLMQLIGRQLATMHEADIVHGDLTTSNMMLRSRASGGAGGKTVIDLARDEVVLIDFGLSSVSAFPEDKAVDLYVLERAFASTHPASEDLFKTVLDSYAEEVTRRSSSRKGGKGKPNRWDEVRKRLEEVRLRGRKRFRELVEDYRTTRFTFALELSLTVEAKGLKQLLAALSGLGRGGRSGPHHEGRQLASGGAKSGGRWDKVRSQLDVEMHDVGELQLIDSESVTERSSTMRRRQTGSVNVDGEDDTKDGSDGGADNRSFLVAIVRRRVDAWVPPRLHSLLPEALTPVARAHNGGTSLLVSGTTITLRGASRLVGWGIGSLAEKASGLALWIDDRWRSPGHPAAGKLKTS